MYADLNIIKNLLPLLLLLLIIIIIAIVDIIGSISYTSMLAVTHGRSVAKQGIEHDFKLTALIAYRCHKIKIFIIGCEVPVPVVTKRLI